MKKTNFLKGLAMAAVALVSVFASCSEENLNIQGTDTPTPPATVLPDAKASVSVTVVDLENGTVVGNVTSIDATSAIGSTITVNCPANDGYTTAKPITVAIPSIEKGQAIVIPVTFYVVTMESAFSELIDESTIEYGEVEYVETHTLTFINEDGWNEGVYTNTGTEEVKTIAKFGKYYTGYHFVETSSRAAETTVEDLLKYGLVFDEGILEEEVTIPGQYMFKHEPVTQEIHISEAVLKDHKGEIIFSFKAQQAGSVTIKGELSYIGHDAPSHDHTHGHGHGHGAGNAGGGEGGDNTGI